MRIAYSSGCAVSTLVLILIHPSHSPSQTPVFLFELDCLTTELDRAQEGYKINWSTNFGVTFRCASDRGVDVRPRRRRVLFGLCVLRILRRILVVPVPAAAFRACAAHIPGSRSGGRPTPFAKMARGPKKHMKRLAAPSHWVRRRSCASALSRHWREMAGGRRWRWGHPFPSPCSGASGVQAILLAGWAGRRETAARPSYPPPDTCAAPWLQPLTRSPLCMILELPPIANRAPLTDAR